MISRQGEALDFLGLLLGRYLVGRVCDARARLLRRPKMFSRREAFLEALSRIVCAVLTPSHQGEALDFRTLLDIASVAGDFAFLFALAVLYVFRL